MEIKTTPLGHTFTCEELQNNFRAVWGGVAWPGKREGFAAVVAMSKEKHGDSHDIYLIDEHEDFDMLKLVRRCHDFHKKYCMFFGENSRRSLAPRWIGDYKNASANRFIREVVAENPFREDFGPRYHPFSVTSTPLLEEEGLYTSIVPEIKALLRSDRRVLFLKDSKIASYLNQVEAEKIAELKRGEFPAVEALGLVVMALRECAKIQERLAHAPQRPCERWHAHDGLRRRRR